MGEGHCDLVKLADATGHCRGMGLIGSEDIVRRVFVAMSLGVTCAVVEESILPKV